MKHGSMKTCFMVWFLAILKPCLTREATSGSKRPQLSSCLPFQPNDIIIDRARRQEPF